MTQATDSKAGLYAKMAAVMAEMSNIPKTGVNQHFSYKFVTADSVADMVRELLGKHGVAFFASIVGHELVEVGKATDSKTGDIKLKYRWVVDFEFTFADGETGASVTSRWTAEADNADDKGINKCATAAEKYFLLKTFIVSSADEPDSDADGGRKRQQTTPAIKPTPPSKESTPVTSAAASTDTPAMQASWVDDPKQWAAFLKSAGEKLALGSVTVSETLERFEALGLGDWRVKRSWALAALIAEKFEYNREACDNYTASLPGNADANFELGSMAKQIINAVEFVNV
jgi:hypothetical protein